MEKQPRFVIVRKAARKEVEKQPRFVIVRKAGKTGGRKWKNSQDL